MGHIYHQAITVRSKSTKPVWLKDRIAFRTSKCPVTHGILWLTDQYICQIYEGRLCFILPVIDLYDGIAASAQDLYAWIPGPYIYLLSY